MTEQELERALRDALRLLHPEADLTERICAHIESNAADARPTSTTAMATAAAIRTRTFRAHAQRHWLPAAIAAAVLIAFGFTQWAQQQQRRSQVRAQLLQGLTIASASLRDARSIVLQSQDAAP